MITSGSPWSLNTLSMKSCAMALVVKGWLRDMKW
jgi:hypothetical protein